MNFIFIVLYIVFFIFVFHIKPLPMQLSTLTFTPLNRFNSTVTAVLGVTRSSFLRLIEHTVFLPIYYRRSELIWLDGFLFDFLQKKSVDVWLRKFVINTGYIFSERLVFDQVVRLYLDNIIWPLHHVGSLETENVSEMLSITIFLYFFFFSLTALLFIAF